MTAAEPARPASTAQAWRETIARDIRQPGAWVGLARCRGVDPVLFYADLEPETAIALELCAQCPVRDRCLEHALGANEEHGVWGGTTAAQRRSLRRRVRRRRARSA